MSKSRQPGRNRPATLDAGFGLELLNFDSRARVGELLPDSFGFFFRNAFFHRLRRRLDQILRFFQTQRRHFANNLDHVDLVAANGLQNDVEFSLLFCRSRSFAATAAAAGAATAAAAAETPKSLPSSSPAVKPPEAHSLLNSIYNSVIAAMITYPPKGFLLLSFIRSRTHGTLRVAASATRGCIVATLAIGDLTIADARCPRPATDFSLQLSKFEISNFEILRRPALLSDHQSA